MKIQRNKSLLLNYIFIFCLFILFLNDHFLKYEFSNLLTGKLSDVTGIIILPLLLTYIFPRLKLHSIWMSAVLFIFWKSGYSEGLIRFYNQYALIPITRVVDYSDVWVLLLLPVPHLIIRRINQWESIRIKKIHPAFVLLPAIFTLMATSPPPSFYYTRSNGNFNCAKCSFTVDYTQNEIIQKLRKENIVFDTIYPISKRALERIPGFEKNDIHFYTLNQLIIDQDTLRNLNFSMLSLKNGRTKVYFNGMNVKEDISTYKLKRKARKYYNKILFTEIKESLKK